MDDALHVVVEMHERLWGSLTHALEDLSAEELHWQLLPHANTISVIIRHLRIEAQWHLDSLERGEPMPTIAVAAPQAVIDPAIALRVVAALAYLAPEHREPQRPPEAAPVHRMIGRG